MYRYDYQNQLDHTYATKVTDLENRMNFLDYLIETHGLRKLIYSNAMNQLLAKCQTLLLKEGSKLRSCVSWEDFSNLQRKLNSKSHLECRILYKSIHWTVHKIYLYFASCPPNPNQHKTALNNCETRSSIGTFSLVANIKPINKSCFHGHMLDIMKNALNQIIASFYKSVAPVIL